MKLYSIKSEYIEYLRLFEPNRIMKSKGDNYVKNRKYVGVFELNGFHYFAPLSSPKEGKDYMIDENNEIKMLRGTNVASHYIINHDHGKIDLLGEIKFNNMLPVPLEEAEVVNIKEESDFHYKRLISKQAKYIKDKSSMLIHRHARRLYEIYEKGFEVSYLKNICPDYRSLEQKCSEWLINKEMQIKDNIRFLNDLKDIGVKEEVLRLVDEDLKVGISYDDVMDKLDMKEYDQELEIKAISL